MGYPIITSFCEKHFITLFNEQVSGIQNSALADTRSVGFSIQWYDKHIEKQQTV